MVYMVDANQVCVVINLIYDTILTNANPNNAAHIPESYEHRTDVDLLRGYPLQR